MQARVALIVLSLIAGAAQAAPERPADVGAAVGAAHLFQIGETTPADVVAAWGKPDEDVLQAGGYRRLVYSFGVDTHDHGLYTVRGVGYAAETTAVASSWWFLFDEGGRLVQDQPSSVSDTCVNGFDDPVCAPD